MKKHISNITFYIGLYWRWILLPISIIATHIAWVNRESIFRYTPFGYVLPNALAQIANYSIMGTVGVVALLVVIKMIRKPVFEEIGINRRLRQTGFRNSDGKYPVLVSKHRDKYKKRGYVYTVRNYGISIVDFDNRKHQLVTVFNGRAGLIEYGRTAAITHIHVIPRKYDTPNIISENDDYMVRDLINLLVVGRTGSGKSYALAVILGALARYNPDIRITICDYKKSSFAQYEGTPNFYGYEDVPDGIRVFYKEFTERLEANDVERNKRKRVLLIDEYGALIAAQEKKQADELRTMVANMLFMGRSLGIIVIIGIQRADSEHFKSGARDQFMAILSLGNLSREQKQMLFADYKDEMIADNGLGEGYLLVDGKGLDRVKIAAVNDHARLDKVIRQAMNH